MIDVRCAHVTCLAQHAGFMPKIVQRAAFAHSIVALVGNGLGVALVPDLCKSLGAEGVAFRELGGMPLYRLGLAFACRRDEQHSVLLRAFRDAVNAVVDMPSSAAVAVTKRRRLKRGRTQMSGSGTCPPASSDLLARAEN